MTTLKAGDKAHEITAYNQKKEEIKLSDFKGKKVILYFYPKDNTHVCITVACYFRGYDQSMINDGIEVLGVSTDSEHSHQKFIAKFELPCNLLSDADQKVENDYGVCVEKNMYG